MMDESEKTCCSRGFRRDPGCAALARATCRGEGDFHDSVEQKHSRLRRSPPLPDPLPPPAGEREQHLQLLTPTCDVGRTAFTAPCPRMRRRGTPLTAPWPLPPRARR